MKMIKNFKEYNKQSKNFEIIQNDNKYILIFKGAKNIYELAEADINSNLNNYNSWNPTNLNKHSGYAWLFNDMRPYGRYIKYGFLKSTKGGEFSVDFVSIKDDHFNNGYKDWTECTNCKGKGCEKCDHQGSIRSNVTHTNDIDHIIVMKRSYYDLDMKLELHTIFKIENENIFKVDVDTIK